MLFEHKREVHEGDRPGCQSVVAMKPRVYWPEAKRNAKVPFVGYNHAVGIVLRAVGDLASPTPQDSCKCRLYFNIPWHHNPSELKSSGLPLVAYTMFESTKMPRAWTKFLNKHFAACIVPTQFCADVFRMSGVRIPIKISTLGVDSNEYSPVVRDMTEGYNFLWQGHNYDPLGRKGAGIAEQAFRELKCEGKLPLDSKLYMKYRAHRDFDMEMHYLDTGDGVIHVCATLPKNEMVKLYQRVDCCVNTTRGEGFGLIPIEQMAMGFPVILTGWSFPFIDERYNMRLKYMLEKSPVRWCHRHISWGKWGFDYNITRLQVDHHIPKLLEHMNVGGNEYGPDLKPIPAKRTLSGKLRDAVIWMQRKSQFYWKPNHARHYLMFEHPGFDAQVDKQDLKDKMLYAVEHREEMKEMGKRASQWVHSEWNLERVGREFTLAINQLQQEGVI